MAKYLIKRIITSLLSVMAVIAIVMVLVYSMLNRDLIFKMDGTFVKTAGNQRTAYMNSRWEEYGYQDYVTYADYLQERVSAGELDAETLASVMNFGRTPEKDSEEVAKYVKEFTEYYESRGYKVTRLDAMLKSKRGNDLAAGGQQQLFATKDTPLINRLATYFTGLLELDNINKAEEVEGERGLTFTLHDPVYNGKFSPAIIGNGTKHKYLLYVDDSFPYIHQNLAKIHLGQSYTVTMGVDVFDSMTMSQGSYVLSEVTYPSGHTEMSADDLHTATYQLGSRTSSPMNEARFTDDYTNVSIRRNNYSRMGFSFVIGILSTILAYCLGLPLGVAMARKKDKLLDKIGNVYIIFIIAVPSLAYIFLVNAIAYRAGLPTTFNMEIGTKLMFLMPIISLAMPTVANLMKWLRRYMIDQMNSDYVKFARSGGLTENEVFAKHILKNAAIPIIHGIPGSILFAMTGAIITERVYLIPGTGNLLTEAINKYDNSVIVGVTMFYAILSVTSIILGDILMSVVDPRISFTSKDR